jgi:glycerophosphoryl diester phosphodiesterase
MDAAEDTASPGEGTTALADGSSGGEGLVLDVQGHRGDRGNVPPGNTIPSFESALALGVDTLEGDLQITADGEVVFGHDADLSVTGCTWAGEESPPSTLIAALSTAEVQMFDCHPELEGVQPPPLLAQVLDLDAEIAFNLEMKRLAIADADVYMQALVDYHADCGDCLDGRLIMQSFNWQLIEHAKAAYGDRIDFRGSVLTLSSAGSAALEEAAAYAEIFSPTHEVVDAALVARTHAAGLQILPWTVNEIADMQRLIDLEVDGIITDYPDRLLAHLGR